MKCRHCESDLTVKMIDLGAAPLSNSYLSREELDSPETFFPLRALVCEFCWLVQTEDYADRSTLFHQEYAYLSSISSTWTAHVEKYAADMVERFDLETSSFVVEVGSNDGCLIEGFNKRGMRTLGVEPTASLAALSRNRGLTTIKEFFGEALAISLERIYGKADLIAANNVLAHVPDINDFVRGFAKLLSPEGVVTFEFPHLLNLVEKALFDTIYHEHFSYLSLTALRQITESNGLKIFEVEELPTHGGSLRVFAQQTSTGKYSIGPSVAQWLENETKAGLTTRRAYEEMQSRAEQMRDDALLFLINAKKTDATVVGYGAAAKGNTFLNFAGIKPDLMSFVADKSGSKQNLYLPGSRIPIFSEQKIAEAKPAYIVILPWNISTEIKDQLKYAREWGAQAVTFVPELDISSF